VQPIGSFHVKSTNCFFSVESSVFSRGVWKCHLRNHDFIFLRVGRGIQGTKLVLRITTLYFYIHHIKDFLLWQLNLMACTYWVHSEVPNLVQMTTGGQLHQPRWTGGTPSTQIKFTFLKCVQRELSGDIKFIVVLGGVVEQFAVKYSIFSVSRAIKIYYILHT